VTNKWTTGPYRVAENVYNIEGVPWTDAIGIEAPNDEDGSSEVPSVIAWTTRGCPPENAALLAASWKLYKALHDLLREIRHEDIEYRLYTPVIRRADEALAEAERSVTI
jgi:hypothetical protein